MENLNSSNEKVAWGGNWDGPCAMLTFLEPRLRMSVPEVTRVTLAVELHHQITIKEGGVIDESVGESWFRIGSAPRNVSIPRHTCMNKRLSHPDVSELRC